uniref:Uncharacterized protein n=1 Tax=viral metagenome TaxID=1070528 RepID=A0A6M3IMM6_9ZZZZ
MLNTGGLENQNYCQVSLTEDEAWLFYWMREYEYIFREAFNKLKPGSLVLHFNDHGKIRKHEMHFYKK